MKYLGTVKQNYFNKYQNVEKPIDVFDRNRFACSNGS